MIEIIILGVDVFGRLIQVENNVPRSFSFMTVQQVGYLRLDLTDIFLIKPADVLGHRLESELFLKEATIYAVGEVAGNLFAPDCGLLSLLIVFLAPSFRCIGVSLGGKVLHLRVVIFRTITPVLHELTDLKWLS